MTADVPATPPGASKPRPRRPNRRGWWAAGLLVLLILLGGLDEYGQYLAAPHPERFAPGVVTQGPALDALLSMPLAAAYRRDFRPQTNATSCGPASLRNVLASLGHALPSERALFQGETGRWWRLRLMGMTLDELAALAEANGIGTVRVWRDLSAPAWRALLQSLDTPGRRLIVNLDRASLHGVSVGHFSPLGGYDRASDRVLLLDVTPGFGAQLIPSAQLLAAMNTLDPVSGRRRGLLQIDAEDAGAERR